MLPFIHHKFMTIMYWTRCFHVSVILAIIFTPLYSLGIPEITTYAKVSKNGGITSEARNFKASPVYIPPKIPKLNKGELIDHPSTQKYSTLDEEMVSKLDARTLRNQAQDRFHPPAGFEHVIAHSNAHRVQNTPDSSMSLSSALSSSALESPGGSSSSSISSDSYATLPQHVYDTYINYPPNSKPSKDNLPPIIEDYSPSVQSDDSYSKIPDSYGVQNTYEDIPKSPNYLEKFPSKPNEYSDIIDHHPTYIDDSHLHEYDHDHQFPYDLIYDHPPDHHHHDFTTTTEAPEMNDQRLNKRPYSYYYIGKKLWYLPLYFSIYFIIYIAALVLKSIARHKINFPSHLAEAAGARNFHYSYYNGPGFWNLTQRVLDAIDKFSHDNSTSSVNSKS